MRSDRAARLTGAVDRMGGENLLLMPMTSGTISGPKLDPCRTAKTVVGTVVESLGTMRLNDNTVGRDFNTPIATAPIGVMIALDQLGDFELRKEDQIRRLDKPGQPCIEVSSLTPNGAGRMVIRGLRKSQ